MHKFIKFSFLFVIFLFLFSTYSQSETGKPTRENINIDSDLFKALKKKGLIKIGNFRKNDNKLYYLYLLTPKGIKKKAQMTINYLKKKSKEYEELKKELGEIKKNS